MAYISKSEVQTIKQNLKEVLDKRGIKFSINGSNSSTVTVVLREYNPKKNQGKPLDFSWLFDGNRCQFDMGITNVNPYWFEQHYEDNPNVKELFAEIYSIMKEKHWDKSDTMSDYFHCAFYAYLKVGAWNKHFVITE